MNETAFASQVEDLLTRFDWWWCHRRPARTGKTYVDPQGEVKEVWSTPFSGKPGFLDYFAVRPPRALLVEIKSDSGEVTPEEQELIDLASQCPALEVYVWWPKDFDEMLKVLR